MYPRAAYCGKLIVGELFSAGSTAPSAVIGLVAACPAASAGKAGEPTPSSRATPPFVCEPCASPRIRSGRARDRLYRDDSAPKGNVLRKNYRIMIKLTLLYKCVRNRR